MTQLRPSDVRPSGILGALSAAAEQPVQPGERILDLAVAEIAYHPDNIREIADAAAIDELGKSIATAGVLQPLIVITRAAFSQHKPGHALPDAVRYVLIDGHQRLAAARGIDVATVPAVVRDHLASDEDTVVSMLITGLQRIGVTPMAEARGFGRLRDRGYSETKISEATGRSRGQVHKRLQLLRLPETIAAQLGAGLTVTAALRLLELPDHEIADAWEQAKREDWRGVDGVVTARLAAGAAREQAQQLRVALAAAGVRLIEDPAAKYGTRHSDHKVPGPFAVPGATPGVRGIADEGGQAPSADVAAHVDTSGARMSVQWYVDQPRVEDPLPTRLTGPGADAGPATGASGGSSSASESSIGDPSTDVDSTPATDPEAGSSGAGRRTGGEAHGDDAAAAAAELELAAERDRQQQEQQRRSEAAQSAAEARAAACARIVTGRLEPELAVEILADTILVDVTIEPYDVVAVAADYCGVPLDSDVYAAAGVSDDPASGWLATQAAAGALLTRRAAVAIALADVENTLAWTDRHHGNEWTARQARHVRRLAAHGGYELTSADEERLLVLQPAGAPNTADQTASAGSTPTDGATS